MRNEDIEVLKKAYYEFNEDVLQLTEKYLNDNNCVRFTIPYKEIDEQERDFYAKMFAHRTKEYIKARFDIELQYYRCYNCKKVVFFKVGDNLQYSLAAEIPYMNRSDYFNEIFEINNLVNSDGCVGLFTNNLPNQLQIILTIQTDTNYEKILELINENDLKLIQDKSFDNLFEEAMKFRKYNFAALNEKATLEDINKVFSDLCIFAETKKLEECGYFTNKDIKKPKVFISYPHASKEIVHSLTDYFEKIGLNIWLDKKEILPGDNIYESVTNGFRECDMFLLFISKSTLTADFAKFEIFEAMSKAIYHEKEIFIVKLDDVNPNDITESLNNYMYYDFSVNQNIEELAKAISEKIDRISKS